MRSASARCSSPVFIAHGTEAPAHGDRSSHELLEQLYFRVLGVSEVVLPADSKKESVCVESEGKPEGTR
jgi:hypothetical protein